MINLSIVFAGALILTCFRYRKTPIFILGLIYSISLIGDALVNEPYESNGFFDGLRFCALFISIYLLLIAWKNFDIRKGIKDVEYAQISRLFYILVTLNSFLMIVFIPAVIFGFAFVDDYTTVKNATNSQDYAQTLPVNSNLLLIANYLHPTAYFLIPLGFYYIGINRYKRGALCLFFSLNIIFTGLVIFSRSTIINFIFIYLFYLQFFYWRLHATVRKKILLSILLVSICFFLVFYLITQNRFENEVLYNVIDNNGVIRSNPILFSIFDYGSQWFQNGLATLAKYDGDPLFGQISFPLLILMLDKLGLIDFPTGTIENVLRNIWAEQFDRFNGIFTNLIFDFGYISTFVLIVMYIITVTRLSNGRKKYIGFESVIVMWIPYLLLATGIFNYEMRTVYFNLSIIYAFIIYFYLKPVNSKKI